MFLIAPPFRAQNRLGLIVSFLLIMVFSASASNGKKMSTARLYHHTDIVVMGIIKRIGVINNNLLEVTLDIKKSYKSELSKPIVVFKDKSDHPIDVGDKAIFLGSSKMHPFNDNYYALSNFVTLKKKNQYKDEKVFKLAKLRFEMTLEAINYTKALHFEKKGFCSIRIATPPLQVNRAYAHHWKDPDGVVLILFQIKVNNDKELEIIMDPKSAQYYEQVKALFADPKVYCLEVANKTRPMSLTYEPKYKTFHSI